MSTLRESFKKALAGRGATSPAALAEQVIADITKPADLRAALAEAAPYMARVMIVETRPATPAPPPSAKSWKRDAIRQQEQHRKSELDAMYATGDGSYKRFGAFDYDELLVLAASIQSLADAHAAKSAHVRSVAEAVKAAGVSTPDELDAAVLADLGVAA
ncbi:MAG: hypothetical protein Q4F65_11985 [Propionibacteriaceae bacterium]|nr:hypothetical protein [Propionibacteriaceae bacterium]